MLININPDLRRGRFIAPIADLSALGGLTNILIKSLIRIIGPWRPFNQIQEYFDDINRN